MIRVSLLWLIIIYLGASAWGNWYRSLCGLIVLMAVIEHPDMPKTIFGIHGLNPWNVLLAIIIAAWIAQRKRENLQWDMQARITILLILYAIIILASSLRMLSDRQGIYEYAILRGMSPPSTTFLISEHIINSFKWVIPAILLFDGCRSRERLILASISILLIYFLLAIQVIKWMPLSKLTNGQALAERSLKILVREIGYHRVNLASMLAGGSWAIFCARNLWGTAQKRNLAILASFVTAFALALTGGRTGYGTWLAVGTLLSLARWRRYLFILPLLCLAIIWLVPGAMERLSQGFSRDTIDTNKRIEELYQPNGNKIDLYTITSGRNIAWPFVITAITRKPWFGYGKKAMQRSGVATMLLTEYGESFPHPHNAYLQIIFDNGIIGAAPILLFFFIATKYSYILFRDDRSVEFIAIGGATLSLLLALLISSIGSQTFYPHEGTVGMWCFIGLMLRVYTQRKKTNNNYNIQSIWT